MISLNWLIFCIHICFTSAVSLFMLRIGERALHAWLCIIAISMNIFVAKQIDLGFFHVTAAEGLAGSYLLGLCLLQEYFGKKTARIHIFFSSCCAIGFLGLSYIHLLYVPSAYDCSQKYYIELLSPIPRLLCASLSSFIVVQIFDIFVFQWLRKKFSGKFFEARSIITMSLSHFLDTFVFTFLGLSGIVPNLWHVITFCLIIKLICTILSLPFLSISKLFITPLEEIKSLRRTASNFL